MEGVAVEKENIARLQFHINELQHFEGGLGPLRIGSGLLAIAAVLDPAQEVGAFEHLHAAVLARVRIDGDEGRGHVGEKTSVLIPIAVVLMPGPGAAGQRLLDTHLGVVMVDLVAEQTFHRIHQAGQPRHGPIDVVARFVPEDQLGRAAFAVLQRMGVLLESGVGLGGAAQDIGLCSIEQGAHDEGSVALELLNIGIRNDPAGHNRTLLHWAKRSIDAPGLGHKKEFHFESSSQLLD